MVAVQIPPSEAGKPENQFEFTMPNGQSYTVPLLEFIKPAIAIRMASSDEITAARIMFEEFLPAGVFDTFDDTRQLNFFITEWKRASGVDMGESEASTAS